MSVARIAIGLLARGTCIASRHCGLASGALTLAVPPPGLVSAGADFVMKVTRESAGNLSRNALRSCKRSLATDRVSTDRQVMSNDCNCSVTAAEAHMRVQGWVRGRSSDKTTTRMPAGHVDRTLVSRKYSSAQPE